MRPSQRLRSPPSRQRADLHDARVPRRRRWFGRSVRASARKNQRSALRCKPRPVLRCPRPNETLQLRVRGKPPSRRTHLVHRLPRRQTARPRTAGTKSGLFQRFATLIDIILGANGRPLEPSSEPIKAFRSARAHAATGAFVACAGPSARPPTRSTCSPSMARGCRRMRAAAPGDPQGWCCDNVG